MGAINYTAPGPVASEFIASGARRSLIMGPFASGKSGAAIMKILRNVFSVQKPGNGPDGPGLRYSRWAVVRNTWPELRDTTMKTWFEWVPNGSIGYYRSTEKVFYIRVGDVRAEIMFRALDDEGDVKKLLSAEYTGAWFNEFREIDKDIVDAMDGRIDRYPRAEWGGATLPQLFGDSNPPEEYSFMYCLAEGLNPETLEPWADTSARPDWAVFRQPSGLDPAAENVQNLKAGRDYYVRLAEGKSKNFVDMYVHGRYGTSDKARRVHPAFRTDLHVSPVRLYPDPSAPVVIACDFGRTPAMVLKQQDPFGRIKNLDEVVTENMGLERAIQTRLKPLLARRYAGCRFFVTGDPTGASGTQTDEKTCLTVFDREDFKNVELARTNNPIDRQGATDFYLTTLGDDGVPLALYDRTGCPKLVDGLLRSYHYRVIRSTKLVSKDPVKNMASHVCEASQYGDLAYRDGIVRAGAAAPARRRATPPVRYNYA